MTGRWFRLLAVLFAFALVAAACGSDDKPADTATAPDDAAAADTVTTPDDAATADTAATPDDAAAADTADDAMADGSTPPQSTEDRTGETIKIGYVNNEGGALSLPEFRTGGEVAIDKINAAGGINGAQIEVVECLSDASPEGAINCANQLIEANVVMAYMGIELASEAAISLWVDAGIPYISSNSWGETEKNSPGAFLMHTASGAYAVGPAKTFADLGLKKIAVIGEDNVAYNGFFETIITPVLEHTNLEFVPILVDPAAPDWTAAIATAQAAGVEGIWGQLTEPGCIGMVQAAAASGWDKPLFAGSCSFFIPVLGEAALGAYTQGDGWFVASRPFAPPVVQERIDEFITLMTDAGYEAQIGGFAGAAYGAWHEIAFILGEINGPITGESILEAFRNSGTTPGWFGPDLHCGSAPWPAETSHCGSTIQVYQVQTFEDGTIGPAPVGDGFFDAFEFSGF